MDRRTLASNCFQCFSLRIAMDVADQAIQLYYPPSKIYAFLVQHHWIVQSSGKQSIRLITAKNASILAFGYGLPFHLAAFFVNELWIVCKWIYTTLREFWKWHCIPCDEERQFYWENWRTLFRHYFSLLRDRSIQNGCVCCFSLLLQALGVGISSLLNPNLDVQFAQNNLSSLFNLLFSLVCLDCYYKQDTSSSLLPK